MNHIPLLTETAIATAAVNQYRLVGYSTGQQAAAGAAAMGITLDGAAAAGQAMDVVTAGTAPVEAGAAFGVGVDLTSDAEGRAVAAVAGNRVNAISREAAAGAGSLVTVQVVPPVVVKV